jgi:hypothetical protein
MGVTVRERWRRGVGDGGVRQRHGTAWGRWRERAW